MKPRPQAYRLRSRRRLRLATLLPFLLAAVLLHIVGITVLAPLIPENRVQATPTVIEIVALDPLPSTAEEQPEEEEEEPEDEPDDLDGQIVETAPSEDQEKPEEADYLAEQNNKVEEETRSERFKINPEVIAKQYSEEEKVQLEANDVPDLQVEEQSTGATVGSINDRFDPARDGTLANLPSKWQVTNQQGLENPVPSSSLESVLAGAPQNDKLDEKRGRETNLNTKEFLYASYYNKIRQLVNFYWNQNLENLPPSVRLAKPQYTTKVNVVLTGNGALDTVAVSGQSGSVELDDCVVRAFKVAGPFPPPPEGLVEKDGRVYLPDMGFTVVLSVANNRYEGIDPRAGVQFPGILKSPR